ncbi:YceI family protein [Neptunicella marina]|uniref:YceI family protein n=1 Tax=Neptunicella marina TaxID=2125989 RepID=A0A8J6LZ01_9ALTE|nr:YceI family protein [Neptunicella marina]MBC3765725.1 YceI family protein [Neptunicella marina]
MRLLTLFSALCVCSSAMADWNLDPAQSSLHFLSTKKAQITEVHQIKTLSGNLSDDGMALIRLDLSSVETNIDIRNQRMQTFLFMIDAFPEATVTANVRPDLLKLAAGESKHVTLDAKLDLHGVTQNLDIQVVVTGLKEDAIQVTTETPVVISAAQYGLTDGVAKLQSLAGLDSITLAVPVSFSVTFTK